MVDKRKKINKRGNKGNSHFDFLSRKNNLLKSKRSQITIFVIIGILLVAAIIGIFLFVQNPSFLRGSIEDPRLFIESCVEESTLEAIDLIEDNGGYLVARDPVIRYEDRDLSYLCYTDEEEELCTSLEPMLISRMQQEILTHISPRIDACFNALEDRLKKYDYSAGPKTVNVRITPLQIIVEIDKEVSFTKNDQVINIKNFDTYFNSPLFGFGSLVNQIINQELSCDCLRETCNADVLKLSRANPDFELERFVSSRNEEIYTLREVASEEEFVFAIRNCVRLP